MNVTGTAVLLDAAMECGVGKVVYTSSSAVFGVPSENPVTRETSPRPMEAYGRAKYEGELLCRAMATRGLDVSIVRPRTILGHGRLGIFGILFDWIADGASVPVLELLGQAGSQSPEDLQTQISCYRVQAEAQLKQARSLDVPDEMTGAPAVAADRARVPPRRRSTTSPSGSGPRSATRATSADQAIEQIAGEMQAFLASDVLYQARVAPLIKARSTTPRSAGSGSRPALPARASTWLSPGLRAAQLEHELTAAAAAQARRAAPGLHGTGLERVRSATTPLQPDAPNRIPSATDTAFNVAFTNQGENDEFDVQVRAVDRGRRQADHGSRTVDTDRARATAEASIPLGAAPPTGDAVTVKVEVAKVPGEEKTDNNTAEYNVLFTGVTAAASYPRRRGRPHRSGGHRRAVGRRARALALLLALVLAFRVRRLRAAQRAVLGEHGQRRPRRPRRRAAAGVRGAARARRGGRRRPSTSGSAPPSTGSTARSPTARSCATTPTASCPATSRPPSRCSTPQRNGVVLSSIAHRDTARLYCKQVHDGQGELELSPEETEAVRLALAGEIAATLH